MSTDVACFFFGIPATLFWISGVRQGIMLTHQIRPVRRDTSPFVF